MKKIFFPTDFSPAANHAFRYALHLADRTDASIVTFHVYREPPTGDISYMPFTMQRFFETVQLAAFEDHRDAIPPLRDLAADEGLEHVAMSHMLLEGRHPAQGILQGIRREAPDMVVMGTKGATGLKEIFLGSVAGEVLENAPCPVMVVPKEATSQATLRRMAFATSYKEEEKAALQYTMAFAETFDAALHVINVDLTHTHFYHKRMDALQREFEGQGKLHFHVLEGNDLHQTIIDYLQNNDIDLLTLLSYKRNLLEELFHYSLAKKLAYHAKTPILGLPASMFED